jgi:ankyrin repeat protein
LVKKGAKINKTDKYKRTPLLLSCKYGYSQITKYLIECGADFNKCDNSQNSPIHYACAFGNFECIKILLESGADINFLNMWRYLPIEIALLKNHIGIVNYLIQNDKFSVDTHFGNGNALLLYYLIDINKSTFEKIKYILEDKKGNGNITNCNNMNAFHFLTHFTYRTFLSIFIPSNEKKILNEEKHKKIYHPQYIDLLMKYINFLKKKGCEPDLQNIIGQTPLMLA